ncbi:MAG: hypothetical protein RIS47_691 [Bacteroidota bacterium]|jgi:outer membrane lipoprotein-sorting protein
MKTTNLLIFFLAIVFSIQAQQDPKAKTLLDEAAVKIQSYQTINADFSFVLQNKKANINETQQGTVTLKGTKFRLDLGKTTQMFDGKTLWTWLKEQQEVHVSEPNFEQEGNVNPLNIVDSYQENFKYIYVGDLNEGGKKLGIIELVPKSLKKPFSKIKILIDKNTKLIQSSTTIYKNANWYVINIKNYQFNKPAADQNFTFNEKANPDVEVVDLRE